MRHKVFQWNSVLTALLAVLLAAALAPAAGVGRAAAGSGGGVFPAAGVPV